MNAVRSLAAAALLALAGTPTFAATLIDFEGVTSFASIADFYAGGTDGAGASGPNLGVSFSGAALALSNDALGPYFANAPTPGTVMFASDASAVMNVAAGFQGMLSFFYSAASAAAGADAVTVYSGLDGTGTVLGSIGLGANDAACTTPSFCAWQQAAVAFQGVGRSVGFGGNALNVAFDNVSVTPVPEPGTVALLALGLAGVALAVRRQRRG